MPVTVDVSTLVGQLRLEIGDTNTATGKGKKPDGTNFSDDELNVWLGRAGRMTSDAAAQVGMAAAMACEALARAWAAAADIELPTRKEYYSQVAIRLEAQAKELWARYNGGVRIRKLGVPGNIGTISEYGT